MPRIDHSRSFMRGSVEPAGLPRTDAPTSGQPAGAAAGQVDRAAVVAALLRPPIATTTTFLLLVATAVTAGVFVGNWFYLSRGSASPGTQTPFGWLAIPPAIVLITTLALSLAAPRWIERRRHLVTLEPPAGSAALARTTQLSRDAGLPRPPRLTWNPEQDGFVARAYGRPGAYRVELSPTVVAAARRRPTAFDVVMRHELSHLRHHDVLPSFAAVLAFWTLLPVLFAPLVWRIVDHDMSLVPDYLIRAFVLGALAVIIRAAVLRSREHDADVRAASWSPSADAYGASLRSGTEPGPHRNRVLGLHPSPRRRTEVVNHPEIHALMRPAAFLTVGLLAGATWPLAFDLFASWHGLTAVDADRAARVVVFASVAFFMAATVMRASTVRPLTGRATALPTLAVVAGVLIGSALSLASTGLFSRLEHELVASATTSFVAVGTVVAITADQARRHRPLVSLGLHWAAIATATVLAGLAAHALVGVSVLAGDNASALWRLDLPFWLSGTGSARAFAAIAAVIAIVHVAASEGAARLRRCATLGLVAGISATLWMIIARARIGALDNDEVSWRYFLLCVWLAVVGAVLAGVIAVADGLSRLTAGIAAAAVAAVTASVGVIVAIDLYGGSFGTHEWATVLRLVSGTTALLGGPVLALAWLLLPARLPRPSRRRILLAAIVGVCVTTAVVAGAVSSVVSA